jgi:hypothetical protein
MPPQWLVTRRGDLPTDCDFRPEYLVCFVLVTGLFVVCMPAVVGTVIHGQLKSTTYMARLLSASRDHTAQQEASLVE